MKTNGKMDTAKEICQGSARAPSSWPWRPKWNVYTWGSPEYRKALKGQPGLSPQVVATGAVAAGKRRSSLDGNVKWKASLSICPWNLSQRHVHKYELFSLRVGAGLPVLRQWTWSTNHCKVKAHIWHWHVRELLEVLKEFRISSLKTVVTLRSNTHRLRKRIKDCHIWWKRTLFSYEALDEPIINEKDNFKINFSL